MSTYVLEMKKMSKHFPGVIALNQVDFKVKQGSIHALMGENGAGKSTLMKCLFGIYKPDAGNIWLDGKEVEIKGTKEALQYGIAMVHQELQPILERSIAENIYCGRYPLKRVGPFQIIDHHKMYELTSDVLKEVGLELNPKTKLGDLSVSQMQSVEIAKAISMNARLLILDEPTSSLTEKEVESLFEILRSLKSKGCAIIYISHKMEEILEISDEVTIMRDGTYVGSYASCACSTDFIIQKMVGRELTQRYPHQENEKGEVVLKVEHYTSPNPKSFQDVSFDLRKGEILGIGGLVGAQRSELVEAIFGIRNISNGKLIYQGNEIKIQHPSDAIKQSIALVTEDRRTNGIFGVLSISDNIVIASLHHYMNSYRLLDHRRINPLVETTIKQLNIKTVSSKTQIQSLSGGNQQKVILGRWLANQPEILILDEPTRGIDVGAKFEIYTLMIELAKQGKSIIMISSEMSELLGMSDRILVMCEGRVSGIVDTKNSNQKQILELATSFM